MARRTHIKDEWQEYRLFQNRALLGGIGVVVLTGVLLARLYWLQVEQFPHYATLSENNRVRIQTLAPNRGLIYDRNGILLAENVPNYQLELIPEQIEDIGATLEKLGEVIALRDADIERFNKLLRTKRRFEPVPLRYNLNDEEVASFAVHRQEFPGVDIQARLTRRYPLGPIMAHVVGYIGSITERELQARDEARYSGTSQIGKVGIERSYEDVLHGYPGVQQVETNAQSRVLRVLDVEPPVPGRDLILSIDARLQKAAFDALGDYKGAVVAIDPRNGEVLAMVSKPAYNPNLFVEGIDTKTLETFYTDIQRPLFNRAINGAYPPGSTIKPMLGLAGLHYGVVTSTHSTFCPGYFVLEGNPRPYRDWKREGHGWTDMEKAIEQSCDVYYYELAVELGIDRIHEFLARFGLGQPTGVDLIGEDDGLLPSREWKRRERNMPWFPGETVNVGIGQGFMLMTPMQLAQSTARIASRGAAFVPRIVNSIHDTLTHDIRQLPPVPLPPVDFRSEWPWQFVINAMEDVVHGARGTARSIGFGVPYRIAGKTGTAQVFTLGAEEEYDEEELAIALRDHGLFIAFAPADDPKIAIAIVVENGGGSSSAVPVARAMFDTWLLPPPGEAP
ncbi:MAG TPA: penicillin-binding protein 2 [Gammaproteobacteria bacterium]